MSQLTTGALRPIDRGVHRACVVAGCWCHAAAPSETRPANAARRPRAAATAAPTDLTAWRSVGLPVA